LAGASPHDLPEAAPCNGCVQFVQPVNKADECSASVTAVIVVSDNQARLAQQDVERKILNALRVDIGE
jgi:hypothetical protein